jgi:hypothetical protein
MTAHSTTYYREAEQWKMNGRDQKCNKKKISLEIVSEETTWKSSA